jgi:2-amino-4-hydroxy-6-hydroxymethyldihydropteridine diphosphokinase
MDARTKVPSQVDRDLCSFFLGGIRMTRCLLALGANLGDRAVSLDQALHAISACADLQLLARSTWHVTVPVGGAAGQPSFLNGAALVETGQSPEFLVEELQRIERQLGRDRHTRWDARTIDIDLLLFGDETINTAELQIPHPRMSFRQFVLAPASEIAGEVVHPISGWTIAALSNHWRNSSPRVAIVGDRNLSNWLCEALAESIIPRPSDANNSSRVELVSLDDSPSMVIVAGDSEDSSHSLGRIVSKGGMVRIAAMDRATVLQEALAAVRAAWPE